MNINNSLSVCVLISCMFQDESIVERTGVQTNVVVVNQCDEECVREYDFQNKVGRTCHVKFISTCQRGLSRSRNMAIKNCSDDICLICDDDELLVDNYEDIILQQYLMHPNEQCITFALLRKDIVKHYPKKGGYLGFKESLHISSHQITFRRRFLVDKSIVFDQKMGSGTGNGGGEENKFIIDIKKSGAKIFFVPEVIATVNPGASQWFDGYTTKYFLDRGWVVRRLFGGIIGYIYMWANIYLHRKDFTKDGITLYDVIRCFHKGFFSKR